jgi:mannose-6-phosphate isomerase-like protein (cupin superfamily)
MPDFNSLQLPETLTALAPDGSEVRVLLGLKGGGMAHFQLAPGQVSTAVTHRTVEEIWFVVSGAGQMWRRQGQREEVTELVPGLCLTIPLGTVFQFRAAATSPLAAVAVTMPPWPGQDEAILASGPWQQSGN